MGVYTRCVPAIVQKVAEINSSSNSVELENKKTRTCRHTSIGHIYIYQVHMYDSTAVKVENKQTRADFYTESTYMPMIAQVAGTFPPGRRGRKTHNHCHDVEQLLFCFSWPCRSIATAVPTVNHGMSQQPRTVSIVYHGMTPAPSPIANATTTLTAGPTVCHGNVHGISRQQPRQAPREALRP